MDQRSTDIALEKRRIRQQIRAALAAMDPDDAAARSRQICEHIAAAPFFHAARVLMAFDPMIGVGEVNIHPLLERALALGKRVCMPRIDWATGQLTPALVTDLSRDMVPIPPPSPAPGAAAKPASFAGLLREPRPDAPTVDLDSIDAILVPGLAFDHNGNRLGRGEGFYDRFLAQDVLISGGVTTCGIAFGLAILPTIPRTSRDFPVDAIATETGIISCSG